MVNSSVESSFQTLFLRKCDANQLQRMARHYIYPIKCVKTDPGAAQGFLMSKERCWCCGQHFFVSSRHLSNHRAGPDGSADRRSRHPDRKQRKGKLLKD